MYTVLHCARTALHKVVSGGGEGSGEKVVGSYSCTAEICYIIIFWPVSTEYSRIVSYRIASYRIYADIIILFCKKMECTA